MPISTKLLELPFSPFVEFFLQAGKLSSDLVSREVDVLRRILMAQLLLKLQTSEIC